MTEPQSTTFPHSPPDEAAEAPAGASESKDWKAEYLRETAQSRKYRQRAQKAEADIEQLRARSLDGEQFEEYQRLRLLDGELAKRDQVIERLTGMVRQVVGLSELTKSLAACGVGRGCSHGEKMLDQAAALLTGRIQVDVSGAEPAAFVLDGQGRPMRPAEDQPPVSIRQFVEQWLAEEGAHFLPASNDTGSGAYKGAAAPPGVDIDALDKDPRAKAEFIARHGPGAYVQFAQRRR